jgi:16S rRNA (guanine527-N7)-methyltransferase
MFHVKHEGLGSGADAVGVPLTDRQARQLEQFERLLLERSPSLGLVSTADLGRVRQRHILDCLRAVPAIRPGDLDAYDLGSGAGLPGLVVAVATPWLHVTLVEAGRVRAAFLELAVERLGLPNVEVRQARIQDLSEPVDVCFARALGDAVRCWRFARPLLRRGGRLVYFAGEGFVADRDLPTGVAVELLGAPPVERVGPVVIMSRQ